MAVSNVIKICRGDSYKRYIKVVYKAERIFEDNSYEMQPNDVIYIGITLPNQKFEDAIIKKRYFAKDVIDGHILFYLSPSDTEVLYPGTYYYSMKLRRHAGFEDESVTTIIAKTKLIIFD